MICAGIGLNQSGTCYIRLRMRPRCCLFLRQDIKLSHNALGQLEMQEFILSPVSMEEMETVLRANANVITSHVKDVEDGEGVTAQSLVQSIEFDFEKGKIENVVASAAGRDKLRQLGHKVIG